MKKIFILTFLTLFFHSFCLKTELQQSSLGSSTSSTNPSALTWQTQTPSNTPPSARGGQTSVVNGPDLVIFGGCLLDMQCYNDLYYYSTTYLNKLCT